MGVTGAEAKDGWMLCMKKEDKMDKEVNAIGLALDLMLDNKVERLIAVVSLPRFSSLVPSLLESLTKRGSEDADDVDACSDGGIVVKH